MHYIGFPCIERYIYKDIECEEVSAACFKVGSCSNVCLEQACSLHLLALKGFSPIAFALNIADTVHAAGNHITGY